MLRSKAVTAAADARKVMYLTTLNPKKRSLRGYRI
jgi:hypothetical protein